MLVLEFVHQRFYIMCNCNGSIFYLTSIAFHKDSLGIIPEQVTGQIQKAWREITIYSWIASFKQPPCLLEQRQTFLPLQKEILHVSWTVFCQTSKLTPILVASSRKYWKSHSVVLPWGMQYCVVYWEYILTLSLSLCMIIGLILLIRVNNKNFAKI